MRKDKNYMKKALKLAKKGLRKVSPNPMVGAIVVKDNKIVGTGYHKNYGGAHAEVFALNQAGEKANGATIYVTLEPCFHYGKTPPCVEKVIHSGIKRCVICNLDPNPLVAGKSIKKMKDNGIEVISGILEKKGKKLNKVFFKYIKNKIPYIFMKTAITIDGKMATSKGDSKWISNEYARKEVQNLRNKYMGIMVGAGTVINDNPRLTSRTKNGIDPFRIIIDPELKIPITSNIIKNNIDKKTIIVTSDKNKSRKEIKEFKKSNIKFLFLKGTVFSLKNVIIEVGKLDIDSILVEGGSQVISALFKEKLIDEGMLFVAPKILGDEKGLSFCKGFKREKMSSSTVLKKS